MAPDAARPERVPQAERRARTRARVLEATIDCLAERGYAATSTTEVARRAGVSRGALLHQFPTKAELVAAAVEATFDQRMQAFRRSLDAAGSLTDRVQAGIDVLWSMFQGDACVAWIELAVAARTDPDLAPHARAVNERHRKEVEGLFTTMVRGLDPENVVDRSAAKFMLALFDGLLLHRMSVYDDDPGRADDVVAAAKLVSAMAFSGRAVPAGGGG